MKPLDPTQTWALTGDQGALRTLAPPAEVRSETPSRTPLPERYEDLGHLASGGMGNLRRVRDRVLGAELAMKILAPRHLNDAATRDLFLAEARVTAQLQHPGIVAVQDFGELVDGRPWFTMDIVQGDTLEELCWNPLSTRRRKLSILKQVADVLAYAHELGAVHRDIKPSNIMIGPFGEVRVMDWGLGLLSGIAHPLCKPGVVVGTPMYMAPEQAAGDVVTPATDVWALGGVLYLLLTDARPRVGSAMQVLIANRDGPAPRLPDAPDLPPSLRGLCHRCLERDPGARPTARQVSESIEGWLDGLQRRQDALLLVDEAKRELPGIQGVIDEADRLTEEAQGLLDALPTDHDVAAKEPAWELQDRAEALRSEALLRQLTWHQKLRAALSRSPDLPEAHALLADHYRDALERAEKARDALAIARNEQLLKTHDRGQHAAYLRGHGALTLHTDQPARAHLFRFVERKRRLVAEPVRDLGMTPIVEVPLDKGSWLVTLDRPGCPTVTYPVLIERGQHWDGTPPEGGGPHAIWMPGPGDLAEDDAYVPAGWCIIGGDPEAVDPLPRQRVWIDGFVMKRFPVTFAAYLKWLQALVDAGDEEAVEAAWPWRVTRDQFAVRDGGVVKAVKAGMGAWPVVGITHDAATDYAKALGWRLPHELWVEKAGRGADGRLTPWGDTTEAQWSRVVGSRPNPVGFVPVTAFETDVSLFGVRGLAGNTRTWCSNWWWKQRPPLGGRVVGPATGTHRSQRGGALSASARAQRLACRYGDRPARRVLMTGMRLARACQDEGASTLL